MEDSSVLMGWSFQTLDPLIVSVNLLKKVWLPFLFFFAWCTFLFPANIMNDLLLWQFTLTWLSYYAYVLHGLSSFCYLLNLLGWYSEVPFLLVNLLQHHMTLISNLHTCFPWEWLNYTVISKSWNIVSVISQAKSFYALYQWAYPVCICYFLTWV
jgi:hypothetical protein